MAKRLPSMNALRSFEAAARHQSFAVAASELSVSPAAVGFQVKRIEEDLGFPLFIRKHRAIELTPQGAALMRQLTKGFDIIEAAWHQLDAPNPAEVLKITAPVAAVKRWLFKEMTPLSKNDVRIAWDMSQMNRPLDGSGVDAAIRFTFSPDPDLFSEPVFRPWFTPHMRPDIARNIRTPADLHNHGLIDVDFSQNDTPGLTAWKPWFIAQGLEPPSRYAMSCADTVTAVDMAVETGHIAIGGYFATLDHISAGRLVAPFDVAVRPRSQLWFLCKNGRETEPEMLWFRNAVKDCAARLEATAAHLEMFDMTGARFVA